MELSVETLCNLLARSRLLAAAEIRTLFQRWRGEAGDAAADVAHFSKWLVVNQYVTEYQVGLLLVGKADHFFLNEYKILDRIGKGRMAGVYRAVHNLGQVVAIKVLPPSKVKDAEVFGRFQREARLALRFQHPNVVRTFEMNQAGGLHYIVMEYLEGQTLEELLQRSGKRSPVEAASLIYQALQGLEHLHEQGVVHRDLKPANLMLVPNRATGRQDSSLLSTVKILDIGLGRALFDESAPGPGGKADLTSEGSILGMPEYMAPEQTRDAHKADIRADVYSLGCVLFHLLAGQAPFPDSNLVRQIIRHANEKPRRLREFNPAVPDALQEIADAMMAKDPAQRYPTPAQAARALRVFLQSESAAPRAQDADVHDLGYVQWLDSRNADGTDTPAGSIAVAGIVAPQAAAAPVATVVPVRTGPSDSAAVPMTQPVPQALAVSAPMAPVARIVPLEIPPEIDVELVPTVALGTLAPTARKFSLSRRNWLYIAVGGGAVLLGGLVGWALTRLLR